MLLRVSCMAILIALACFQFSSAETKLMDKFMGKSTKTETASKTLDIKDTKERNKRALYYQNDLISNKERQIRKAFPFGTYGAYDYAYGLPAYDYLAYDYYYNPLLGAAAYGGLYDYGLYGGGLLGVGGVGGIGGIGGIGDGFPARAAAAPVIAGTNAKAVQTVVNPAVQAAVEYDDYQDDINMLSAHHAMAAPMHHNTINLAARPLSHIQPSHYNGYAQQQHFVGVPQQFAQQAIAPQAMIAQQQQQQQQAQAQQYASNQRNALNAIRAASTKGNSLNA